MALRIRRLAALAGILAATAVATHEAAQGYAAMDQDMAHDALVVCILVFTGLTVLAIPRSPTLARHTAGQETFTAPRTVPAGGLIGVSARASPVWLQRFLC